MGAIGGLFGSAGGVNGTGIGGPEGFAITPGASPDQLNRADQGVQNSLQSQQALLTALQGQGGIGNQSQVYNQLQGVANGTGPNPAQAMLQQQTGQNVANQAALMAGQRGASSNVGLMARQAAQQGAQTQQNAVGQAASMQAQQSMGALGAAGNIAGNQVANQMGATTANTQANQNYQGTMQNAISQANNSNVAMRSNMNAVQGQLANTTMQGQQGMIGGAMQGIGQAMTLPSMASGGVVPHFADGGPTLGGEWDAPKEQPFNLGVPGVSPAPTAAGPSLGVNTALPQSSVGQYLQPQPSGGEAQAAPVPTFSSDNAGAAALAAGMSGIIGSASKSVGNFMSTAKEGADKMMGGGGGGGGGMGGLAMLALNQGGGVGTRLKAGGAVPGQAQISGNSLKNDTVTAKLSPGELVIDRETMADKGPAGDAARFLAAVISAKKRGK